MENLESLEEGLIEKSSNPKPKPVTVIRDEIGEGDGLSPESQSSATPAVVLSTLVAICGSFACGCSSGYSSPAESGIMADMRLSLREYSVFGSLITVGGIIGSSITGKTSDLLGRRGAMWLSQFFSIAGWMAIGFSKELWSLYLGRFSIGIGVGFISYVIPVYVTEITPRNIRGAFAVAGQFLRACGFSLMYMLGTLLSWNTLALIAIVPCLLQVIGLCLIPESPRWLAKVGQEKELEAALQRLRGKNVDISKEATNIREYTKTFEGDSEAGIFILFQRRYAYSLLVGVGVMLMIPFVGATAIAFYSSSIFAEAGFSSNIGMVSMAIIQIPAVGLSVLLTDKLGRKPLIMASALGMGLSYTITALAFFLQDIHHWDKVTPVLVFAGILMHTVTFSIGMAGLPSVIMSEILPMNIKGSAGSLATLVFWCGSWISTYTFNSMMEWSSTGTFSIFAVHCAATALFIAVLVPETKGRTLEEIQIDIAKFSQ